MYAPSIHHHWMDQPEHPPCAMQMRDHPSDRHRTSDQVIQLLCLFNPAGGNCRNKVYKLASDNGKVSLFSCMIKAFIALVTFKCKFEEPAVFIEGIGSFRLKILIVFENYNTEGISSSSHTFPARKHSFFLRLQNLPPLL